MGNFPEGLRVLVVDDDFNCLSTLEQLLQPCHYQVTTCQRAKAALSLLRGGIYGFDIVLTEIYMPEMDGFQLLEIIRQEMDYLPVVMMSSDGRKEVVMKGVNMGACDFLMKPVRIEEISIIWQHVVRKQKNDVHSLMLVSKLNQGGVGGDDELQNGSKSPMEKCGSSTRERREEELHKIHKNDINIFTLKKSRMIWTPELHQQFVAAVNHIGLANAVPKKILEHMKVAGLTRENVASHLQKYRIHLQRKNEKKFISMEAHPAPPPVLSHAQVYVSPKTHFPSQIVGGDQALSPSIYHAYNNDYHHTFSESSTSTCEAIRYQENFQGLQRIEGEPSSYNQYTTNAYYAIPMACTTMTEDVTYQDDDDDATKYDPDYSAQETLEGGRNSDHCINFCPCPSSGYHDHHFFCSAA